MKIFIDSECKCHIDNPDNAFREYEVEDFNGKCQTFIEGHRYCPPDESYTRDDGEVFHGECIVPWKPLDELEDAQHEYEKQLLKEYQENSIPVSELEAAYQEGVNSAYD